MLTTVSAIASVGRTAVYVSRRLKKFSMHSKRSARASWLASTSLAACDRFQCKDGSQTVTNEDARRKKDANTSEDYLCGREYLDILILSAWV